MRITIDTNEEILKAVVAITGEKTRNKAIRKALQEYVRRRRMETLLASAGKIELTDNLDELKTRYDKD
ncbi:MAG: type II toxin-antitoxin system VapB family antitoxin [Dehalococcoidia bacterium]|nr:type II toxin-antitoxin system VapB family antitoxin [Dehalococcoidia bacterium]